MDRKRRLGKKIATVLAVLLPSVAVTACLNMQPKVLGQQGKFDFSAFNTNTSGSFKFNFALYDANRSAGTVYLQGATSAKSTLIGTCNFAGTGCTCSFYKNDGTKLGTTSATQISYDDPGNYYRCTIPTGVTAANIASVSIQTLDGTTTSGSIPINTPADLTLAQLIGPDLDINRVRSVYRYACEYNFLEKDGTTTQGFDCTNVGTLCDTGNFCLLKARFPFYLYTDTYSTNFSQKISDKVYNGSGSGVICGLQIKQLDCVGTASDPWGAPVKKFGLYDQLSGVWQTSVQLPGGPDLPSSSYGFAAQTSTITGECPPGLIKQIFWTVSVVTSDIFPGHSVTAPGHNFPNGEISTEVADPAGTLPVVNAPPAAYHIRKFGTPGNCGGTTCTMPLSEVVAGAKPDQAYSTAGATAFCVIPPSMLP